MTWLVLQFGGEVFNEIGREMFAENHRRRDLIGLDYGARLINGFFRITIVPML